MHIECRSNKNSLLFSVFAGSGMCHLNVQTPKNLNFLKSFRKSKYIFTVVFCCFVEISKDIKFRENDQKMRKTRRFLPAKLCKKNYIWNLPDLYLQLFMKILTFFSEIFFFSVMYSLQEVCWENKSSSSTNHGNCFWPRQKRCRCWKISRSKSLRYCRLLLWLHRCLRWFGKSTLVKIN